MAGRVVLLCHGSTAATRRTAFALDEPLEPAAIAAAAELARQPSATLAALFRQSSPYLATGPALRCRQTADALRGLDPDAVQATVDPALADWDLGHWAGRSLDEVAQSEPDDVAAWLSDPGFGGHGGETLTEMIARVGRWLDDPPPERRDRMLAVTHPAWMRAAVVHALQAPPHSFWRIDVAPLTVVHLRGRPHRWSLLSH